MKKYEIIVEGEILDLGTANLNIQLNNQRFDPVFNKSVESEYSFSFDIPSTPKNNKIFNYADNLSKTAKFNHKYKCSVYANEMLIFSGHLIINSYSFSKKSYNVNLVVIKVYDGANMFGTHKMSDLNWNVDYQGADTINAVNGSHQKYFFPLVSYGKFQKVPYFVDDVASDYTSNSTIDQYNRWWHNSFPPSLNMLETLKRLFEQFGNVNVGGSAFSDPKLSNVFMSYSIAEGQQPQYNLGNDKFGRVHITNGHADTSNSLYWTQSLNFPYRKVEVPLANLRDNGQIEYNFSHINVWNILGNGTIDEPCYMYDPNERLIVIPSDGFYEITLNVNGTLNTSTPTFNAAQWYADYKTFELISPTSSDHHTVTFTKNLCGETPLEIQLVKNYDDNIELIKGRKNVEYMTGDPTQIAVEWNSMIHPTEPKPNKSQWETEFPHEGLFAAKSPTKENNVTRVVLRNNEYSDVDTTSSGNKPPHATSNILGYMHKMYKTMPYDAMVNPNFICGFSTMDNGQTVSVLKNGFSFDRACTTESHVFADVEGLERIVLNQDGTQTTTQTTVDKNVYRNSGTNSFWNGFSSFGGSVKCCIWLNEGDKLELMAVQRDFDGAKYGCTINYELDIRAITPKTYKLVKTNPNFAYGMQSEFPYLLNLGNFLNNEVQISDWIENIKNTFNLTITRDANNVTIDANTAANTLKPTATIDLDRKVNSVRSDIVSKSIDYPSKMGVEWDINTDEYGYEMTVPDEHINDSDWAEYGERGTTIIELNNPMNEDERIESVPFSYCWYTPFTKGTEVYNIATIALSENMIDDFHDTGDAMVKDGYSLTQRFWYRDQQTNDTLPLASNGNETVNITLTKNNYGDFNLSYKTNEQSIFTTYFNGRVIVNTANYVQLKVYLTAEEYLILKGCAYVKFDKDLYIVQKIEGFSPMGESECTLTLYK